MPGEPGGALYVGFHDQLVLTNVTVANNRTVHGAAGGVHQFYSDWNTLRPQDSVIARNAGGNCLIEMADLGGNLDDDGTCAPGWGLMTGLDPELKLNGGATRTHALLAGSSAIGAGGACSLSVDQRGHVRDDGACDSGAFEFGALPAPRLGVSVTGFDPRIATCRNRDNSTSARIDLRDEGESFECTRGVGDFETTSGDEVVLQIDGRAETGTLGGEAVLMTPDEIRCNNLSSGQTVVIFPTGERTWNCVAAGLLVSAGDQIELAINGLAD